MILNLQYLLLCSGSSVHISIVLITLHLFLTIWRSLFDMNQEIIIESNEVEEMQCLKVEELFGQLKSHIY